ncbi:MAG TPA: AMP-binding protein, partial [Pirellulales bacterium]|nr:AMP-binding protein [Pirellulales bacterium]
MNIAQLAHDNLARFGDVPCIYFDGREYTSGERLNFAQRLASVFAGRGVAPGDRVVAMLPNGPSVLACFQAAWQLGAVLVPVTPQSTARELHHMICDSGAQVVITGPELASVVAAAIARCDEPAQLLVMGPTTIEGAIDVEPEVAAAQPRGSMFDAGDDDLALLIYTSGTTGRPKGVMQTHANLYVNLNAALPGADVRPQTRMLHVLPLSHVFGVLCMNLGTVYGCSSVILPQFEPRSVLEAIDKHRIARIAMVPTMLTYLLNFPDRKQYDCSSLKIITCGGAALPDEVRVAFEREFGCRVKEGYGCSEGTCALSGYHDEEPTRPGSVGKLIDGAMATLLDDADRPVAAGCEGEICVRGPHVMKGYWRNEEATRQVLRGGWLHTGDLGRIDADGYLYITGRKKDLIIKGGENIAPRLIEDVLYEHAAVAEAAVIGVADPVFGEEICAFIALKAGNRPTAD